MPISPVRFIRSLLPPLLAAGLLTALPPASAETSTLQFRPGFFSATIHHHLMGGQPHIHTFHARGGQMILIALGSEYDDARFRLFYRPDADSRWQPLPAFEQGRARRLWRGALPASHHNRYRLIVHTPRRATLYDLFISLPPYPRH